MLYSTNVCESKIVFFKDIVKHSVHTLVFRSLKRTHDMFLHNHTFPLEKDAKRLVVCRGFY